MAVHILDFHKMKIWLKGPDKQTVVSGMQQSDFEFGLKYSVRKEK